MEVQFLNDDGKVRYDTLEPGQSFEADRDVFLVGDHEDLDGDRIAMNVWDGDCQFPIGSRMVTRVDVKAVVTRRDHK